MGFPVKIYILSTCPACEELKKLLDDDGTSYEAVVVDLLTDADKAGVVAEMKELSRLTVFPTIVIGDTVITGFRKRKILSALDKQAGLGLLARALRYLKRGG